MIKKKKTITKNISLKKWSQQDPNVEKAIFNDRSDFYFTSKTKQVNRNCLLSFSFTCLHPFSYLKGQLSSNQGIYVCEYVIWSVIEPKITQDKQLHAEKTVKILLRIPELVYGFAD